tara:strand:+ start:51953 stop:53221 length:1269 start_codon:yes stop_codon:yes gene_type:complete
MQKKLALFATIFGNIFEYYDFVVFGLLLIYIRNLFLPELNNELSYILSLLLFSIGSIARPLGAYILGKIGDSKGRRICIIYSMSILTIATFLIGCLPTYEQAGIISPILLILLRLMQNFSVSIEQVGGALFLIEYFSFKNKYLLTSLIFSSVYLGATVGSIVVYIIVSYFGSSQLLNWAWRIPFWLSLPLGVTLCLIRLKLSESKVFLEYNTTKDNNPVKQINYRNIINSFCSFISLAVMSYFSVIFIPNLISFNYALDNKYNLLSSSFNNILIFLTAIIFGYYIDHNKINGKVLLKYSLIGNILLALPIFILINNKSFFYVITAQLLFSILLAMQSSSILANIYQQYHLQNRFFILNMGFNIAMTLFGGFSPFVAAYLNAKMHNLAPALYVILTSLITYQIIFYNNTKQRIDNKELHYEYS